MNYQHNASLGSENSKKSEPEHSASPRMVIGKKIVSNIRPKQSSEILQITTLTVNDQPTDEYNVNKVSNPDKPKQPSPAKQWDQIK